MDAFLLLVQVLLGAVFVMSAVPKLVAPRRFVQDVLRYRVGPQPAARAYGWLLPYMELGVGFGLLLGWNVAWAAGGVLIMVASFMVAVAVAMARGESLTCSCFGLLYRERVGWKTQSRDAFLGVLALGTIMNAGSVVPVWEMALHGSLSSYVGVLLTVLMATASLGLGYVSVRGWPGRSRGLVVAAPNAAHQ